MRSAVFATLLAAGFVAPSIADDKVSDGPVPPIPDSMAVDVPKPDTGPPLTTDADIVVGVAIDAAQCKALSSALWLRVSGRRFCVRYWLSTAGGAKDEALIFLHGDVGGPIDGKMRVMDAMRRMTAATVEQSVEHGSRLYGGPYVAIGRPGAFGSSGHHVRDRRTRTEIRVVAAALDELKARHGLKRFHLAGTSGGGHTVAALTQTRDDIGCAVVASGAVSLRTWYRDAGRIVSPALWALYNPIDHVSKMRQRPGLRLIALSDPDDKAVSYRSQREFVDAVRAHGLPMLHLAAAAPGKRSHDLRDPAMRLAVDCANGADDQTLMARYQTKPAASPTAAAVPAETQH